jgi:hypothetical protein
MMPLISNQQECLECDALEYLGHFEVHCTHNLLQGQYWWQEMHTHVQHFIAKCIKVRPSFNAPTPKL